jgi:hypothetical protein
MDLRASEVIRREQTAAEPEGYEDGRGVGGIA